MDAISLPKVNISTARSQGQRVFFAIPAEIGNGATLHHNCFQSEAAQVKDP